MPQSEQKNQDDNTIILTVYISGTNHSIDNQDNLGGLLHELDENPDKMGFSGCAVTHPLSSGKGIFGTGVDAPFYKVAPKIREHIKAGKKVKLIVYGHSRGGISALRMIQELSGFTEEYLESHLVLVDPVPGNTHLARKLDRAERIGARKAKDLSHCQNLKSVFVLYPNSRSTNSRQKHLPFDPILPTFPPQCQVYQDVIVGEHSDAQYQIVEKNKITFKEKSFVTFIRIQEQLEKLGCHFKEIIQELFIDKAIINKAQKDDILLEIYRIQNLSIVEPSQKSTHDEETSVIKTHKNKPYLNLDHKKRKKLHKHGNDDCALQLVKSASDHSKPIDKSVDTIHDQLQSLANKTLSSMTTCSQQGTKGAILKDFLRQLEKNSEWKEEDLKNALRNIIALSLQRDRSSLFFTTSTSGNKLVELLNDPTFSGLKDLIGCKRNKEVSYKDLTKFVCGIDNLPKFYARNKETLYSLWKNENHTIKPVSSIKQIQYI